MNAVYPTVVAVIHKRRAMLTCERYDRHMPKGCQDAPHPRATARPPGYPRGSATVAMLVVTSCAASQPTYTQFAPQPEIYPIGLVPESEPDRFGMIAGSLPPPYAMAPLYYVDHLRVLVRNCHAQHPPRSVGNLWVEATIDRAGKAKDVKLKRNGDVPDGLLNCLQDSVLAATFSAPHPLRAVVETHAELDARSTKFNMMR